MTAVYRSAELGAVLVERRGVLEVVNDDGRDVRFTLPADAVELFAPDTWITAAFLDEVRTALAAVPMSAKARRDVAAALDELEPA